DMGRIWWNIFSTGPTISDPCLDAVHFCLIGFWWHISSDRRISRSEQCPRAGKPGRWQRSAWQDS
ncbi:hypothetical protein Q6331_30155, partial [Klebsiella pneumoniae]